MIMVEDGDYKGERELYLKHAYEGVKLDKVSREKTMAHIHYLWDRPVHLESMANGKSIFFTFDGNDHLQK